MHEVWITLSIRCSQLNGIDSYCTSIKKTLRFLLKLKTPREIMKNKSLTILTVRRLNFIYITQNKNFSSYLTENIARDHYKEKSINNIQVDSLIRISETTAHVNTLCGKIHTFLTLSRCQILLPLVFKWVRGPYFIGSARTIGVCRDRLNPRAVCYSFVTAAINLPLSTHICRVVLWALCQMFVCGIFSTCSYVNLSS